MEPLNVQKKIMPRQHYFWHFLLNLTKVILLRHDFFLDFRCVCCYKVTVLYLYLVVWGVTDWAFSVWFSNCTYSGDLCHFSPILAQLPPPATWPLFYFASVDGATKMFISWFWNQYYLQLVCTESSLVLLISKGKESLGRTAFGLILRDIVFDLEHNHSGCSVMDYPIWYGVG